MNMLQDDKSLLKTVKNVTVKPRIEAGSRINAGSRIQAGGQGKLYW